MLYKQVLYIIFCMIQSRSLSSLETLSEQYDCFIFDIYGVIYDGVSLIHKTLDFIYHLREQNKAIALLSNSQRQSKTVLEQLNTHGFFLEKGEKLFTSGEYFRALLNSNQEFKNQHIFYHLGDAKNLTDINIKLTTNLKEATYILLTLSTTDKEQINMCDTVLKLAIDHGCTSICFNPDITAPRGNEIVYTPGYLAKKYEDLGGKVMYFGKPYKGIYEFFINEFLNQKEIQKQKTVAIGDSISTDIRGAMNFGIDSLFVFSEKRKLQSSFNNNDQTIPTYSFAI